MKLECSVEELKLLFKNFDLREKAIELKIDGEKVGKLIAPSINKTFKQSGNITA